MTTLIKKTKRGNVMKIVKENYLRDDISCGFDCKHDCANLNDSPVKSAGKGHILIPDFEILSTLQDLLLKLPNLVVLQTFLNVVKTNSNYFRFRKFINDSEGVVFLNEHHKQTYSRKTWGETVKERDIRVVKKTLQFYQTHLSENQVYFITEDQAYADINISRTPAQYIKEFYPQLEDLLVSNDFQDFSYAEHYTKLQLSAGLKGGKIYQGIMNISAHNYLEGSVTIKTTETFGSQKSTSGNEQTITIFGRETLNRAVNGDLVAIEVLPKSEWISSVSAIVEEEVQENPTAEVVEAVEKDKIAAIPTGKVVGILKRNWRPFCGTIDVSSVQQMTSTTANQSVFFWSLDKKIPKIRIKTRQAHQLVGKRIIVSIDSWDQNSKYPSGHYVRTVGEVGDKQTETEVLLLEHDVPFAEFSPLVLSSLPEEGTQWVVTDKDLKDRKDFRGWDVCSIDPPGCTDIDDALHAKLLDNGNYEVGVHIADVSHFVKPGTAMDDEAQRRGTTVYLVDKRIDMLPGLLGTNLCSLRSDVDRLAFSCIWEITPEGEILSCYQTKSIIRSKNSFTYDEAQKRLDDTTLRDPISLGIKALNMIAKKLRKKRMAAGALTLASPEVRFTLENGESQDPVDVGINFVNDHRTERAKGYKRSCRRIHVASKYLCRQKDLCNFS